MVDDPFVLPDVAHTLTADERSIVLATIAALLEKRVRDKNPTAPVYNLQDFKTMREGRE